MATLTFEYDGIDPVVVDLPQEKAALIVNEFIEAQRGPTNGTSTEKLLFLVEKIKEFVLENAQANYLRKAKAVAEAAAAIEATELLSI